MSRIQWEVVHRKIGYRIAGPFDNKAAANLAAVDVTEAIVRKFFPDMKFKRFVPHGNSFYGRTEVEGSAKRSSDELVMPDERQVLRDDGRSDGYGESYAERNV